MSAPILWIAIPFLVGIIVLLLIPNKYSGQVGGTLSTILALIAILIPIDQAMLIGTLSIKISSSIQVFGRSFTLNTADGYVLIIIYGLAALWFLGTQESNTANRFVSFGLMIISLLIASIAVEPFLYAALLIEIAAMLVIPLLVPSYQKAGKGVVRFLISQTLAMPFILFSGWLLAGIEASPGDVGSTTTSGIMLVLGFAFLFAIFPLYNWIPMLLEEASPYATGFLLWALPTFTTIFALDFLDRYTWLRNSPGLMNAIQFAGVLMVTSGGIFASLQRHIGRILGYAAIAETGFLLLIIGLQTSDTVHLIFITLIPRGIELVIWALALSILKGKVYSLKFSDLQGIGRTLPVATASLIIAHLSISGFPLLAGFPSRFSILGEVASQSLITTFWVFAGIIGLLIAAIRTLAVFVMTGEESNWELNESWVQVTMLGLGVSVLFILGMFPQILNPLLENLPALFERLGQ